MEHTQNLLTNLTYYAIGIIGALFSAVGIAVFLAPANIAALGVGGAGVLANHLFGVSIGTVVLILNVPIFFLVYRTLPGGLPMLAGMAGLTLIYSLSIDLISPMLEGIALTDDRLLNAMFGGVTLGIGGGLVYRSGFSLGGTYALALILRRKLGTPMASTYFYTDILVIIAAGFVFNVEGALYSSVVLFLNGLAQDYVMEGPSVIRTAMIITDYPDQIADSIMKNLYVGVTQLPARGMYTGQDRVALYVTVSRAQSLELRQIVSDIDDRAFLVIGHGHVAYGGGFRSVVPKSKKRAQERAARRAAGASITEEQAA